MHDTSASHFTGDIPDLYDRGLGPVIFADFAADIAARAADSTPTRVLETAAGTGILTRRLRDTLPAAAHLTATDLNVDMLNRARARFSVADSITFMSADATALPFDPESFDLVVCQFGVMFFPDKPRSYREVRRVLRSGGRFVFNVWDSHAHNAFGRLAHQVASECSPADPPPFFQVPFGYHDVDVIRTSLLEAGFTDVEVTRLRLDRRVADVAVFARGLVFGTPLIEQIRCRRGVEPEILLERLTNALVKELGLPARPLELQAIIFEAC